jgi:ABC-type nitrate/sulfonate/bicarbonate transport system substrate-binding protein
VLNPRYKALQKISKKRWAAKNREKCREYFKAWEKRNPEKAREFRRLQKKAWAKRNPEKARQQRSRNRKRDVEKIADRYIRRLLGISGVTIPPELIEVKRLQLKIMRLCRKEPTIN